MNINQYNGARVQDLGANCKQAKWKQKKLRQRRLHETITQKQRQKEKWRVNKFHLLSDRSAASEDNRKTGVRSQMGLTMCCPSLVCKCSNIMKVFALFLIKGLC